MPEIVRAMQAMLATMQQQNVNLVNQHDVVLQQLEAARQSAEAAKISAEASERLHMEALQHLGQGRSEAGSSQAPPTVQEWSLKDFIHHRPPIFDGKASPDEAD